MEIGAIVPHVRLYGGVRRYLELGNAFVEKGHGFHLFSPQGTRPDWLSFSGSMHPLARLPFFTLDALLVSEEAYVANLLDSSARAKIFYVINKNKALRAIGSHPEIVFMANSTTTYRRVVKILHREPLKAFGGVDTKHSAEPAAQRGGGEPIVVMTYGRLSRPMKGMHLVVKACERLQKKGLSIRLVLFDSPVDERARQLVRDFTCGVPFEFVTDHPVDRNHELYGRAHVFAIAERKGGWSNTSAEAMAAGAAAVATNVGTEDFLKHERTGLVVRRSVSSLTRAIGRLADSEELRRRLAEAGRREIRKYDWRDLAERIIAHIREAKERTEPQRWPCVSRFVETRRVKPRRRSWFGRRKAGVLRNGVYVICYHSVVDKRNEEPWEKAYWHVATRKEDLAAHVEFLCREATAVRLGEIPHLFAGGAVDRPYFAITFDDGYANVARHAAPIMETARVRPAVFVSGSFADQTAVYFRALAALLESEGHEGRLREKIEEAEGRSLPARVGVFAHLKNNYRYRATEEAVVRAWQSVHPDEAFPKVHLDWQELRELQSMGWEIGSHTYTHPILSRLTRQQQEYEMEENARALDNAGLGTCRWLAYPGGSARHVNLDTLAWMERNGGWHGAFANGGTNRIPSRMQWQRMGISDAGIAKLVNEIRTSDAKMDRLFPGR